MAAKYIVTQPNSKDKIIFVFPNKVRYVMDDTITPIISHRVPKNWHQYIELYSCISEYIA